MTNSCTTSEAQSADSQYSPDFFNLVEIKSRDGLTGMWVHRDVISRSSSFIKAQLEKGPIVLLGEIELQRWDAYHLAKVSVLNDYIHWLYTGAVVNGVGNKCDLTDFAWQWKIGTWLRDVDYANAVMDKLIVDEYMYDLENKIFFGCKLRVQGLRGSKLWNWVVDCVGAAASAANMGAVQLVDDSVEGFFLQDVLIKVLSRIEDPQKHQIPVIADREKYHLTKETFEDTREVWTNRYR